MEFPSIPPPPWPRYMLCVPSDQQELLDDRRAWARQTPSNPTATPYIPTEVLDDLLKLHKGLAQNTIKHLSGQASPSFISPQPSQDAPDVTESLPASADGKRASTASEHLSPQPPSPAADLSQISWPPSPSSHWKPPAASSALVQDDPGFVQAENSHDPQPTCLGTDPNNAKADNGAAHPPITTINALFKLSSSHTGQTPPSAQITSAQPEAIDSSGQQSGGTKSVKSEVNRTPTSETWHPARAESPFCLYCTVYDDYTGANVNAFVRACVVLRDLRDQNRIEADSYDDFIRFFTTDYIDYIQQSPAPLIAIDRYNQVRGTGLYFSKAVVTPINIDLVLNVYSHFSLDICSQNASLAHLDSEIEVKQEREDSSIHNEDLVPPILSVSGTAAVQTCETGAVAAPINTQAESITHAFETGAGDQHSVANGERIQLEVGRQTGPCNSDSSISETSTQFVSQVPIEYMPLDINSSPGQGQEDADVIVSELIPESAIHPVQPNCTALSSRDLSQPPSSLLVEQQTTEAQHILVPMTQDVTVPLCAWPFSTQPELVNDNETRIPETSLRTSVAKIDTGDEHSSPRKRRRLIPAGHLPLSKSNDACFDVILPPRCITRRDIDTPEKKRDRLFAFLVKKVEIRDQATTKDK